MRRTIKNHYEEIDKALKSYEEFKSWHDKTLDWITDRIDWCHKWKKITEEQTTELVDRVCIILKRGDI